MERHGGDHTTPWTIQAATRCESGTYERWSVSRDPFGVLASGQSVLAVSTRERVADDIRRTAGPRPMLAVEEPLNLGWRGRALEGQHEQRPGLLG